MDTSRIELLLPTFRVGIMLIAAVNDDIATAKVWPKTFYSCISSLAVRNAQYKDAQAIGILLHGAA